MNSNDELIQAIDYTFQSPFVRKIVGVTVQEDQNRLDSESADKIKASSHMLGSIRNEHENARNVIIAAAHENPTKYLQTLTEYLENLSMSCQKNVDTAQQELDDCPKIDAEWIKICQQKKQEAHDETERKEREIKEKFQQEHMKDSLTGKIITILSAIALVIVLIAIKNGIMEAKLGPVQGIGFLILMLGALIGFIMGIISTIISLDDKKKLTNGTYVYPDCVRAELNKLSDRHFNEIKAIEKNMKRGYAEGSDFEKRIHLAEVKLLSYQLIQAKTKANIGYFTEKIKNDPVRELPDLLKKAVDNIESLSNWAADYIREQRLEQHYANVESIEEQKLHAQKVAQQSHEDSLRAQTALLQRQAEAAEQQAKAVQQQARDTEEIKRRLENEKYGDIRRRYAGEKFPWEK